MPNIIFRNATPLDAAAVVNLVNLAYRTEGGWTTESHLIIGDRLVEEDYLLSLKKTDQLILLAQKDEQVVGCIEIKMEGIQAQLGMLAVLPQEQDQGIASDLLDQAEKIAKTHFDASEAFMLVLDVRKDLLEYYFRKGYQRANEYAPFPMDLNVGKPISENLILEKIIKHLD
ncbi:GNAT family N-acetyltransferase [Bermanella sp. WJH001]|uniref:GNAT family N-acetyltransferase n=1 Tax=Bermanella sp. WJH001 TaxID=3048005 RepID=UPI0024BE067D|nr:GNAT family N-acetyltransferase [Bermanella sp. WJH001]MDJ1537731.1 GNAT family N-acetyltransferase [Bermanella sp. WJH001]